MDVEPSTSKNNCLDKIDHVEHDRKRKLSTSSSSDSDSASSSSSSDNRRKRSKRKHTRKNHHRYNRKFNKIFNELKNLKEQFSFSNDNVEKEYTDRHDLSISDGLDREEWASPTPYINEQSTEFNLSLSTKVKEPTIPPACSEYLNLLKDIQRLGHDDWSSVRYADVQKQYQRFPGFTALEANDEIRRFDSSRSNVNLDRAFSSITFALLKQREILEREFRSFFAEARESNGFTYERLHEKITNIFANGEYIKTYNDTLQLVCGHRAEAIQHRREAILSAVKEPYIKDIFRKIPPSTSHLFDAGQLSTALEKAGGVKNSFWQKDRYYTAPQTGPGPSQVLDSTVKPNGRPAPAPRPAAPRGPPARGPFRGGRGRSHAPRHGGPRARSPASHRDRRAPAPRRRRD